MRPLILLVDDDRDFLEMNRGILEAQGFRVECFTDTDKAWDSLRSRRPALVIADLMMKSLDSGFSLARKIKTDPGVTDVPVIIVTAVGSRRRFDFNPQSRGELEAMGADAFFDKPVAPDLLIAKVKELLS
jgi:CheY-like chemotaxis protein